MQRNILTALSGLMLPLAGYAMPAASSNTYQRSYLAAARQAPATDLAAHSHTVKNKTKPIAATTEDELQLVQANPVKELIIIDSAVPDKAVFYKAAKPGTDIVELTADADGLQQLTRILQQYQGLTALHLVSHAEQGALLLGNSRIDAAKLQTELMLFSALNGALEPGADVLLYGCNLAKGQTGDEFLNILQANTHVDLAASNNVTGNQEQGGDWELEVTRGNIESTSAFSAKTLRDFSAVLAPNGTFTFPGAIPGDEITQANPSFDFGDFIVRISTTGGYNELLGYGSGTSCAGSNGLYASGYQFTSGDSRFYINADPTSDSFALNTLILRRATSGPIATTVNILGFSTFASTTASATLNNVSLPASGGTTVDLSVVPGFNNVQKIRVVPNNANFCLDSITFAPAAPSNNAPTDIALSANTLNQSAAANAVIGTLSSTDADGGDTHTYTLVAGAGSTDNALFNISGNQLRATTPATIAAGNRSVRVRTTDSGNGNLTFEKAFTIVVTDNVVPAAPSAPDLAAGSDTGASSTDNLTNDDTPTFTGTAEANSTVTVISSVSGTLGTTSANGAGNWSFTAGTMVQGAHTITATATDAAANTSVASSGLGITIDTTAPAAPSTPDLTSASDSGSSNTDNLTNDNTPTFTGTAEANSMVTVISSVSGALGTTTADGAGNWSFTAGAMAEGAHTITATATDAAGNVSVVSSGLNLAIDTSVPAVTSIAPDGSPAASDTSVNFVVSFDGAVDNISTDDFALGLTGSANGSITGVSAASGTTVNVTVSGITGNGTIKLNLNGSTNITDAAGNVGPAAYSSGTAHTVAIPVVPDAPTIGTATAADGQANVTFTAPGNNGGSAITTYTATASPDGAFGTCAGPAACTATVSGLNNGTAYTFTVTATNAVGTSVASGASNAVTPKANQIITFANPGAQNFGTAPTLTATSSAGIGYAVSFTSATTGVCTITTGGALTFVTAGICTIDADQAGDAATNAATTVTQSFAINAIVPGAPTIGTATAGDSEASISFVAPASAGGANITGYTVTSSPGGFTGTGAGSPITVTGLTNGVSYTFTVTASNAAGTGAASAASNAITPASPQTITFNNPGAQNFGTTPTLTATSSAGAGYTVTFTSSTTGVCTITSGGALTFVTAGTCTINADQAGDSSFLPASQVSRSFSVNPVVPGAPTAVVATAADTAASIAFNAPASNGGVNITGYTVTSNPGGLTAVGAGSPIVVNGLTNGTPYTFTITATNSAGTGAASAASNAVTPNPANSAPVIGGTPANTVDQGADYLFTPTASDVDAGTTLQFSITNKPGWATFDTTTGALSGTPAREHVGISNNIVISVSDGELSASLAAFSIEVVSVNDAPVAVDDNFTLPFSANHTYLLDVLLNDTDPDADSLSITAAKASIGLVSIQSNKLQFTAPDNFSGTATFSYNITDGELTDMAQVTLLIEGSNPDAPVITAPDALFINANGLFTKVNVGVATAIDANGNRLPVSLVNGLPMFSAGRHELYWRATDASGVSSTVTQLLQIAPLVSLSKPQTVINNSSVTVEVILNGRSPVYPMEVAYTVSGSADALTEHDLTAGSVQIISGLRASFSFNLFADLSSQPEKDIVITLDTGLNLGANANTTINVTEANLAPMVVLAARQQGENRLTVSKADGLATITAQVSDPNPGDNTNLQWQADAALNNISGDAIQFVFDPAGLANGVYRIALTATDDAALPLSNTAEIYLLVQDTLPVLDNSDSNNNLIADNVEGFGDSNSNGIPDYLDPGFDCNVIPEQLANIVQFVAEGEPGICLRKGTTAALSNSGGIQLTTADQQALEPDMLATNIGGSFDFMLHSLPAAGASYRLVLPQRQPVPQNAVYRKFTQANGWSNFVQNERNQLFSAAGEPGFCPPPGSSSWQPGLTAGHWCVQLQIEDGGANDADGLANSTIVDPGGVAVVLNGNQLPVATDDSYAVQWNQSHTLQVLENDTDADGDTLSINQTTAAFGSVSISADGLTLLYTPAQDFVGTDTLSYGVSDGNNGSAGATVTVEVYYNRPPVVTNATADTNDKTAIDIDVLANASDPDGDALVISSAGAQTGTVTITAAQTLRYTPQPGFSGTDTVSFSVSDNRGGSSSGEVVISVTAYEVITVVNKSSGGAVNGWPLLLLALLAVARQRKILCKALLLLSAALSFSASANWSVDAFFGKSTTKQSVSEIRSQLPAATELLQYDNSGRSWALGLSYYFTPRLAVQAHYVDLGDASISIRGETLTADAFHRSVSDIGPMLAKGVRSGLAYDVWQHAGWSATVQAGVFAWNSESDSTAGDNLISYKTSDTDIYWALGAGYALDQHLTLRTTFTRYHLDGNKADNIMLGVSYAF